jgi:hypothetical protein
MMYKPVYDMEIPTSITIYLHIIFESIPMWAEIDD